MLDFLIQYAVPIIVGICLCVGYMLKNAIKTDVINPYIPCVMGLLGVGLNVWINNGAFTPVILLEGLFSGLASTGLYELFKNLIEHFGDK